MSRLLLLISLIVAPCVGQADDDWQTIDLVRADDLSVNLRIRKSASLANEKWIVFEFRNRGDQPLAIQSVSYRFESRGLDAETGKPLYTSGLGQGNEFDLFGKKSSPTITLPVGATETWRHPSDYATALISHRETATKVEARLYFTVTLKNGRVLRAGAGENDFVAASFLWSKWKPEEIPAIQARLQRLLDDPGDHHSAGYAVGKLLETPEIAASFSAKDLVNALGHRMKDAFSGRDPILRHLNEHFHDDESLLDFVHAQITEATKPVPRGVLRGTVTNSSDVQTLLQRLPRVWRDDFLEGLLILYKRDATVRNAVLRHLSHQGLPKSDDQQLARQLSSVFFQSGEVKKLSEEVIHSAHDITTLGMTRDRRLIPHLAPLLRDRRELPASGLPIPTQRVCDVARSAILTILDGRATAKHPNALFTGEPQRTDSDDAIAQLEKRLQAIPEFATLLRPPMKLGEGLREIAERWKAKRQTSDFLKEKKIVEAGMSVQQVRDVLGPPIQVVNRGDGSRHLYLEPDFRSSLGEYHWLSLDRDDKVLKWNIEQWNPRYDPSTAPPITVREFGETLEHGEWDDIFVVSDRDDVILRRSEKWSKLTLPDTKLISIGDFPGLGRTTIEHALTHGEHTWLLCESKEVAPFAIELDTGKRVPFTIDGVELPAAIQSHIVSPSGTVLLMISGGEKSKWPRDGNHPIYHWMDLDTGKSHQLPTGWDPDYFLPDLSVAVGSHHGAVAVDLATGLAEGFGPKPSVRIEFDWGDRGLAHPLSRGPDELIGVSVQGRTHQFRTPFVDAYISTFRTQGNQVAFHLRGHTQPSQPPRRWSLWTAELKQDIEPEFIADNVQKWEFISPRYCAFTTALKTHSGDHREAFFYDIPQRKLWNVLDGIEDLTRGPSTARVIAPFGASSRGECVLCLTSGRESPTRLRNHWKRWVVASTDQRHLIEKIPEEASRNLSQLRLHNSGTLVLTTYRHHAEEDPPSIRFQLSTMKLNGLPPTEE